MGAWLREVSGTEGFPRRWCPLQTPVQLDPQGPLRVPDSQCGGSQVGEATLCALLEGEREERAQRRAVGDWAAAHGDNLARWERDVVEEGFLKKVTFKLKVEGMLGKEQQMGRSGQAGKDREGPDPAELKQSPCGQGMRGEEGLGLGRSLQAGSWGCGPRSGSKARLTAPGLT